MNMVSQTLTIPNLRAGSDYLCELSLGNPMLAEEQMAVFLERRAATGGVDDNRIDLQRFEHLDVSAGGG